MDRKPLVSIVLPVYNGARLLGKSIESCLRQTYQDIELIIVDDASTDNTIAVARSFHDDRIKLICHQKNRKLSAALNTGFAHSSGAYLTWTSDDNCYVPTAIAELVNYLEADPKIDFVFANQHDVDESGQVINETIPGPFEKLTEWCCGSGAFLYKRSVYEKLGGYDEKFPLAQDYDYWLRAYLNFNLGHLDCFLYDATMHPGQMTYRFSTEMIGETLAVKRKNLGRSFRKNRLTLYKAHIQAASRLFFEKQERWGAAGALIWAILFNPRALTHQPVVTLLTAVSLGPSGYNFIKRAARRAYLTVNAKQL
jgi:glycosyltransferase involved in cell wall biosynthesis